MRSDMRPTPASQAERHPRLPGQEDITREDLDAGLRVHKCPKLHFYLSQNTMRSLSLSRNPFKTGHTVPQGSIRTACVFGRHGLS